MHSKTLRLFFFALAVCFGLVGCFLALDAFFPKEKSVSSLSLIGELAIGVALIVLAALLGRRNRRSSKIKA
jgi:predicted permease